MKDILIIDDSALMRSVLTDIVQSDNDFKVSGIAKDGLEALELLANNKYDGILLDINMPHMNGIEFLEFLKKHERKENILVVSTDTVEGAEVTIKALELGAFDFLRKPDVAIEMKASEYKKELLDKVRAMTDKKDKSESKRATITKAKATQKGLKRIVVIASSTGGPAVLRNVIPGIDKNSKVPILIVQHMPQGFTKSFADRLSSMSTVSVIEADNEQLIEPGNIYIARGGRHLKYQPKGKWGSLVYGDEPPREGVKPCANYLFESLMDSDYDEIICIVLTGMGQDGTEGIYKLSQTKNCRVIIQDPESCVVYGMPKAINNKGLVNEVLGIDEMANRINELIAL